MSLDQRNNGGDNKAKTTRIRKGRSAGRPSSNVRSYFSEASSANGTRKKICNFCNKEVSSNATRMKVHIERCEGFTSTSPSMLVSSFASQPEGSTPSSDEASTEGFPMDNPTTRERKTDAVAKSMGELLLKGYRMMSTSCQVCYNVLLQDKQGKITCIACEEKRDETGEISDSEHDSPDKAAHHRFNNRKDQEKAIEAIESAESLLMTEITSATHYMETLGPATDLHHKQIYIRHIRECAETISALRAIK